MISYKHGNVYNQKITFDENMNKYEVAGRKKFVEVAEAISFKIYEKNEQGIGNVLAVALNLTKKKQQYNILQILFFENYRH